MTHTITTTPPAENPPHAWLLQDDVRNEAIVAVLDCLEPEEALRVAAEQFVGNGYEIFDDEPTKREIAYAIKHGTPVRYASTFLVTACVGGGAA